MISPGATKTDLSSSITEQDIADGVSKFMEAIAVPAETFANMVAFAMNQPDDVDIDEIIFRPTKQDI